MKVKTLIEAIEAANRLYKKKHKKDMEIFDLVYEEHPEGDLYIRACKSVSYDDVFSCREGKNPAESIMVHFEIEDGKIDDRSVRFRDDQ